MTEISRIRRNSIFSLLSISSRLVANVIVFWFIARYYGPEVFGQFTLAHTISTLFILFADFGFDILLTTEVAREKNLANKFFRQFFSLKIVFTSAALIVMWVLALINNFSPASRNLILVFSFYTVFTTLTNFLFALYKGFENLEYETKVSLLINLSLLLTIVLLILLKADIIFIGLAFVVTRFFGFIVGIYYSRKVLPEISYKLLFDGISEIKGKVLVFGFHLFFSYLFFQIDTILLSFWKGDYEVGIYQSVFKLIMLPLVIPDIFINTLMPVLARLHSENIEKWKKVGYMMNKLLIAVVLPMSVILYIYSEQIIYLIYGKQNYSSAIPILKVFAVILFVRFSLETYALMLTTSNRQVIRLRVVIFATILNLILNSFFIPEYGAFGAAIVSLVTNTFVGAAYILSTKSLFKEWMLNFKTMFFLIVSMIIGYITSNLISINIFIGAFALLIVFILISYNFFFSKEERDLIFTRDFKLSFFNKNL